MTNTEVRLARRPDGAPTLDDFTVVTTKIPEPGSGQILVRNRYLALGAVMRTLVAGGSLVAKAVGEVVAPGTAEFPTGTGVLHRTGWQQYTLADPTSLRLADLHDPLRYLSGGLTALAGLLTAGLRAGETVYVSGAAGAVGSAAGAVARALGAGRIVGSTGSARKLPDLTGLGFDAAFDHRAEPIGAAVARLGPVDVVFDTLGRVAELVEAVGPRTRLALCGALAQQLGGAPDPRLDVTAVIAKRLSLLGFTAADNPDLDAELARLGPIHLPHTVVEGLAAAPRALLDLFAGRYIGAVLVRVDGA